MIKYNQLWQTPQGEKHQSVPTH